MKSSMGQTKVFQKELDYKLHVNILLDRLTDVSNNMGFIFWKRVGEGFYWQRNCLEPEIWFISGPKRPKKEAK
jgi:hypothetical protein